MPIKIQTLLLAHILCQLNPNAAVPLHTPPPSPSTISSVSAPPSPHHHSATCHFDTHLYAAPHGHRRPPICPSRVVLGSLVRQRNFVPQRASCSSSMVTLQSWRRGRAPEGVLLLWRAPVVAKKSRFLHGAVFPIGSVRFGAVNRTELHRRIYHSTK